MKTLGQILLWAGFLSGSLATVFNLQQEGVEYVKGLEQTEELGFELKDVSEVPLVEDGWNLIPWVWYGISAGVCLLGVVLIRLAKSGAASNDEEKNLADLGSIKQNLSNLISNGTRLQSQIGKLAPSKITQFIDDDLAVDFRDFAEGRECMVANFGLNTYADVMTNFAAGERAMNRAWSAAADGYVDEATTCVERSIMLLQEAASELDQAEKNGSQH